MALIIPHASNAGIAVANAGSVAPYRSASAFVTPGRAAMPDGLAAFARGLEKFGDAVHAAALDRQRMRNATDLLADKVAYEDALRQFDSDYRRTRQGVSARNAEEDYNAFHQEQYEKLREKWGGNPFLMEAVNRMAAGIRGPSMTRAVAYRDEEEEKYQKSVADASVARTLRLFGDPAASMEEKERALRDEEDAMRLFAGQRRVKTADGKEEWTGGENVTAKITVLRQKMYAEHLNGLLDAGRFDEAENFLGGPGGETGGASASQLPPEVAKIAQAEARAAGISPELVMAVIEQESGGKADAVSDKGARGLMQLMPETARELGVDPDDPGQNVKGGAAYLGKMINRYGGNIEHALMAYNWGPGNTDAWLKTGKGSKGRDMPAETRAYVSGVLGRMAGSDAARSAPSPADDIPPAERERFRKRVDALRRTREYDAEQAEKRMRRKAAETAYAGIRETVRGLPDEEATAKAAAMLDEEIEDPEVRRAMYAWLRTDLETRRMRRDAEDMTALLQAEKTVKNMLPSERLDWLDANWTGSREGRERAEAELTKPPKTETPENRKKLGELRIAFDLGRLDEEDAPGAAWSAGLTAKQAKELEAYCAKGGQAGLIKDIHVKRIWDSLNRKKNGKAAVMPPDLPDLAREAILSLSPGKTPTDETLRKVVARLSLAGESRTSDVSFFGFGKDETLADAMRNDREGAWLSDSHVPVYEALRKKGMDTRIRELLAKNGVTPTAEKIVLFSLDKEAMKKYGLAD